MALRTGIAYTVGDLLLPYQYLQTGDTFVLFGKEATPLVKVSSQHYRLLTGMDLRDIHPSTTVIPIAFIILDEINNEKTTVSQPTNT